MKHIGIKLLLIALLVGFCLFEVIPPQQKIRLGKDLQGGVSLVYAVKIADDADADDVLAQTIDVLKDRVNPQGILDIAMQPVGRDRIEVVMPLPNAEVRALQQEYRVARDEALVMAKISATDLDAALEASDAESRFGGGDGDRAAEIRGLQTAWDQARVAREALAAAEAEAEADPAVIGGLLDQVADAEIRIEDLRNDILAKTLREQELLEILALEDLPTERGEDGELDPSTSERSMAMARLRADLPHLATALENLEETYRRYEAERTGLDDPEDLKRLLRGAGVLEFRIGVRPAAQDVPIDLLREQLADRGPNNTDSMVARWFAINDVDQWTDEDPAVLAAMEANPVQFFSDRYRLVAAEKEGRYYILLYTTPDRSMTHADGDDWAIRRASRTVDDLGRPAVAFGLDQPGGSRMRKLTAPNVNQPMAIVLDGEVYTAPNLNSQIGSNGVIQGNFGDAEITYLIRVLAAGSLEARLSQEPISTSILGPSIGQDNLVRGLEAVAISVAIVALIMVLYYFGAGLVADISLLINAIMIFGIMAMIDGTFTLPGLAGIALTIGMAVDANVLIFERVREELVNNGEDLRTSLRLGFNKAASAILDGNITNLIVCFILYQTAATEVKGFALTLSIGVLATLFTSLFVSRVIFALGTEVFGIRRLPMLPTAVPAIHRLLQPNINWVGLRGPVLGLSVILAAGSLFIFFGRGADVLETEFRGGVSVVMTTRQATGDEPAGIEGEAEGRLLVSRAEVAENVADLGRNTDDPVLAELASATVLTVGPTDESGRSTGFQIKVANPPQLGSDENISDRIVAALVDRFGDVLAVTRPVGFAAEFDDDHSKHTYRLESQLLSQAIDAPSATVGIGDFRGGVAVVVDEVDPPITITDFEQRLDRMRNQPDFADTRGRQNEIVGLVRDGESGGTPTWSSFAVMVADEDASSVLVDLDTWDRTLAIREFELVKAALTREASLDQVSSFSPKVAENLAASAIVAVILSLLGMLVYIWFRFGSLRYSLCAIAALVFNVSICLGAIALSVILGEKTFNGIRILDEFRIDLNVVAGLLTIVGYSLNDTIVILDRIRENRGKLSYASREVVNSSINQTFSRTIMTSGTTITSAIILYTLGGTGIRPFAFTFLVGLIAATYSSVAIAAPLTWSRGGGRSDTETEDVPTSDGSPVLPGATTG